MKILNRRQGQRGVGLIEVLVALVIIAVGVIAVLGLQGTLMSGSSTAKARNEAVALAREKTEELRNAIELGQFDIDLAVQSMTDDPGGKIDGVNAQFTRSWSIAEAKGVENTREIVMQVTWKDAQDADNQVELNTLVAYTSPLKSAVSKQNAGGPVRPGGTDTGYEGLHGGTDLTENVSDNRNAGTDPIKALDDKFGIQSVLRYSNGHVQVRIPDPNCPAVNSSDVDCTCPQVDRVAGPSGGVQCVVFTAFGGTLLRFGGKVYVDNYLNKYNKDADFNEALLVKATSPAYCAHQRTGCGAVGAKMDCLEYMCYTSGDCAKGGADCPTDTAVLDKIIARGLSGGWYGKIGYLFPKESSSNFPTVCMSKKAVVDNNGNPILDNNGNPILDDIRETARLYYSERTDANTKKWREGINESYSCHNTLIMDKSNNPNRASACPLGYEKLVTEGIVWNSFEDNQVIRSLAANATNNVLSADETYCNIIAIYGDISFTNNPDPVVAAKATVTGYNDTLLSLDTTSYSGYVDGECVVKDDNQGIDYACNYIDTVWSGYIRAEGKRTYTINTIIVDGYTDNTDPANPIWVPPVTVDSTLDYTCIGYYDYPAPGKTTGRYGEDIFLYCYLP